ncbi:MAG: dephospho-CoA kinase [Chloroflexi bacterium]|nr:dephospho-CoA kinase [Chloroflexota bacterium]
MGLTGNIGCGKSTIARMLAERGAFVIDADRVAHELMAPHSPVWERIVAGFGPGILRPDDQIDRRALGSIVFDDPAALTRLEQIVHPAVVERVEEMLRSSGAPMAVAMAVVEAIKLIESGMHRRCDSLWVVTCQPEQQLERVMGRGLSREQALARINAQPPQAEKVALADEVIDNSGSLEDTQRQVEEASRRSQPPL